MAFLTHFNACVLGFVLSWGDCDFLIGRSISHKASELYIFAKSKSVSLWRNLSGASHFTIVLWHSGFEKFVFEDRLAEHAASILALPSISLLSYINSERYRIIFQTLLDTVYPYIFQSWKPSIKISLAGKVHCLMNELI